MDSFERYVKNTAAFSREEVAAVRQKRVCVVGCGGLGGHVAAALARFGVGMLTLIDGDAFAPSNLNRQLFATESTLGQNKAEAAARTLADINSGVAVTAIPKMLDSGNAARLLAGHDLALDCLDSIPARRLLDAACRELELPYIHGAIGGFYGQASAVFPGDGTLARIYPPGAPRRGLEETLGNPAFTPQVVAGIQCAEALRILAGRPAALRGVLLSIDLIHYEMERVAL